MAKRVTFSETIKPFVSKEIDLANNYYDGGEKTLAFYHLERAHVLAQQSPWQHFRAHGHMFWWAARTFAVKELLGQTLRLFGAATQGITGYYPPGNTGGADISPYKELPIPHELNELIDRAKAQSKTA